jgi:hypothetical protein
MNENGSTESRQNRQSINQSINQLQSPPSSQNEMKQYLLFIFSVLFVLFQCHFSEADPVRVDLFVMSRCPGALFFAFFVRKKFKINQ